MPTHNLMSSSGRGITSIPLISISRSPSPSLRRHTELNPQCSVDGEDDWDTGIRTPFFSNDSTKDHGWRHWIYNGGSGHFLFNTPTGWQLYTSTLILWLGGCQIGLILMNRIILWTGVYKFPYPLTTTFMELLITHFFVTLSAYITRWVSPWLVSAGLSSGIAPSRPLKIASPIGFRSGSRLLAPIKIWLQKNEGGIAGGGFFEFDPEVARLVLPCASIFVAKICLSNLSFAYAQLQIYFLARIATVPLSLLFTYLLARTSYSVATISSVLTATLTLLIATARTNVRVTWESIVAGILSSIFVVLYPIQIQRTYQALVSQIISQGEHFNSSSSIRLNSPSGSSEETRAYWRLLHYTSILSMLIFIPIILLSGEVGNIWRNCYTLDVFFHWLMILCGGLGSWAVFWATIALTRATSPFTVTSLFIPRAAFLLPIISGWQMPTHSWVGLVMCWACCLWLWISRNREAPGF
ncbi:GDP-fucose transporter 1 [Erysiphe necator]|uniref:GDP-mannose transporter n=1 Tax=Uncinula necator TaxID=52586 RepID=A0A0B1P0E9_UNCNE|nr:GDP-fucose transporter 1 [Erysiphe necator]KHJ32127.1 putative gdp-fucose transporter protein [Erysiphe necator]